jgi:hypothetical protein
MACAQAAGERQKVRTAAAIADLPCVLMVLLPCWAAPSVGRRRLPNKEDAATRARPCYAGGVTPQSTLATVASVIQLAVAPVFLVSGVAALLAVLANRLGRIIDRARALEMLTADAHVEAELLALSKRARLINKSITLATTSALLVCSVIVVLFLGTFFTIDLATIVALLFVVAMGSLIAGLLTFLSEIRLATRTLMIGRRPE